MSFTKKTFTAIVMAPLLAALSACTHNIFIGLHELSKGARLDLILG